MPYRPLKRGGQGGPNKPLAALGVDDIWVGCSIYYCAKFSKSSSHDVNRAISGLRSSRALNSETSAANPAISRAKWSGHDSMGNVWPANQRFLHCVVHRRKSPLRCDAFSLRFALSLQKSVAILTTMQASLRVRYHNVVNLVQNPITSHLAHPHLRSIERALGSFAPFPTQSWGAILGCTVPLLTGANLRLSGLQWGRPLCALRGGVLGTFWTPPSKNPF